MSLTGSFPLILIHLTLAIRIDDPHMLQHRSVLCVFFILGVYFMEFLLVNHVKVIFSGQPVAIRLVS